MSRSRGVPRFGSDAGATTQRWHGRLPSRGEAGFTLVELIIGVLILSIIVAAIGTAMYVTLGTTDATGQRMGENHDVQIESSYLANDVQSAAGVNVPSASANCSGAFTTLATFTYASAGSPQAVYQCGTASNGQIQVTRTFGGGLPIVLAHFAGTARPNVQVTYDPAQPSVPVSVRITFTKASDCTLDCTYTLFGSRRNYNPATSGGSGSSVSGDITVLSTGGGSPLWVQGACPDPGTTTACFIDPTITALPISDVQTTDWTPTPASPTTLFDKLNDGSTVTLVTNAPGRSTEARVLLSGVNPPATGVTPTVEFHASPVSGSGSIKVTVSLYNGNTLLVSNNSVGPINQSNGYDWQLTAAQASAIPSAAYANLTVGFAVNSASNKNLQSLAVDGIAVDTASPAGLLTIKGPLWVNSQLSNAVRLTGSKTATKISVTNGGNFQIWNPGSCSGCSHNTVTCAACTWNGNQPWTSYANPLPDPLRALPAPDPSTLGTGSCQAGTCQPGVYASTLSLTSNTTLNAGVYYLRNGISVTGNATLTSNGGVVLYIAGGSGSFAGNGAINIAAPSTGVYKDVVVFQARNDSAEFKVTGNAGVGATNVFGGYVYVPASNQVTLATGSASLTAKSIVAQNIKVSSAVTIG